MSVSVVRKSHSKVDFWKSNDLASLISFLFLLATGRFVFPPVGQAVARVVVGLIYNMQQSSHRLECSYIVRYCDLQSVVRHTASEVVEIQLYRSFDESSLLSCCLLLYKRPLPPRESVRDEKVL